MPRIQIKRLKSNDQAPPDKVGECCTFNLPELPAEARTLPGFLYWLKDNHAISAAIFGKLLECWGPDLGLPKPH